MREGKLVDKIVVEEEVTASADNMEALMIGDRRASEIAVLNLAVTPIPEDLTWVGLKLTRVPFQIRGRETGPVRGTTARLSGIGIKAVTQAGLNCKWVPRVALARASHLGEAEDLLALAINTAREVISSQVATAVAEANLDSLRGTTEEGSLIRSRELGI